MAPPQEDLIDFNIIESHKENIQALPSGRSAKALAALYSPPLTSRPSPQTDAHSAERAIFESEVATIEDADDPLDVYDRYIKWTLATYPSAQSTPTSQLFPLLERATKAFVSDGHYKNDVRYLRMWLQYISLISDAPREAFIFMARNGVGQELALFYEEYAAWLETQGRWTQAEEVYKLGMEKEARPVERLARKFGEFEKRRAVIPAEVGKRPDSPALPVVRQVLGQKVDPFAGTSAQQADVKETKSKKKSAKMAIFADEGQEKESVFGSKDAANWDGIGSFQSRKKENTADSTSWAGQTLKVGKTNGGVEKMKIFKVSNTPFTQAGNSIDAEEPRTNWSFPWVQSDDRAPKSTHEAQYATNPKTGRTEVVFVNLGVLYPARSVEHCFEEVMARRRGWQGRDWRKETTQQKESAPIQQDTIVPKQKKKKGGFDIFVDDGSQAPSARVETDTYLPDMSQLPIRTIALNDENDENAVIRKVLEKPEEVAKRIRREERANRTRKIKMTEVRHEKKETQTVQLNLASPSGPKLKRKRTAEPTMTINTREAVDEIYGIFSQPAPVEEVDNEDEDSDDNYTSGAESTMTGKMSANTSEYGDETRREILDAYEKGVVEQPPEPEVEPEIDSDEEDDDHTGDSQWSDYTKGNPATDREHDRDRTASPNPRLQIFKDTERTGVVDSELHEEVVTPLEDQSGSPAGLRYVPLPPEDYEPNNATYRDKMAIQNNRLPFMTPIAEHTETSIGTGHTAKSKDYFNAKTPCRSTYGGIDAIIENDDEPFSSPFQAQVLEAARDKRDLLGVKVTVLDAAKKSRAGVPGPIIQDVQVNPVDPGVRALILDSMQPGLSTYSGFFDHRKTTFGRLSEIKKAVKAISKKSGNEKTASTLALPPPLDFPDAASTYIIRKELGAGAFAPVYLVDRHSTNDDTTVRGEVEALKLETSPPNPWEFHILTLAHRRLSTTRAAASLVRAHELHLYSDASFLIEDYSDTGTLLDLVNLSRSIEGLNGGAGAGLEESLAMFYAVELLRTVEALHSQSLIHGDLKCDNMLVRIPTITADTSPLPAQYDASSNSAWSAHGLTLIDFGRAIDTRDFRADVRFVADWPTTEADCVEMRELRPWTHQIDYHGLAGTVHTLLFGRYMSVVPDTRTALETDDGEQAGSGVDEDKTIGIATRKVWRIRDTLKRYWQTEIWSEFFAMMLNSSAERYTAREQGGRMPLVNGMRNVREKMEAWLAGAEVSRGEGLGGRLRRLEDAVRRAAAKK